MPTLLLPARYTPDSVALWRCALARGWNVQRLAGPGADVSAEHPVLYLDGMLGSLVAARLGLELLSPPLDWLATLPFQYRKRQIRLLTWNEARDCPGPAFFKPADDKWFAARVYPQGSVIDVEADFDPQAPVLISEPVSFGTEFRFFVLDRQVLTGSQYALRGEAEFSPAVAPEAQQLLERMLADPDLKVPEALVVDIGETREQGWVVVEANPAWASGLYLCDPDQAFRAIAACSGCRVD